MGGQAGRDQARDVALPFCVQFIEQLPKGRVVAKGRHVRVGDKPAVVAVVLTGAHQANREIYVTDGGSQSDQMIVSET